MTGNYSILDWDSNFFGIKTARIDSELNSTQLDKVLKDLCAEKVDLVYLNSIYELPALKEYTAYLLDKRIALSKKLLNNKPWHSNIKFYNDTTPTYKLIELSRRVARRSRFFYDTRISREKVYELYEIWVRKSTEGTMASKVIVYEDKGEIMGFATIKVQNNKKGYIPLLAVDSQYEGQGISFHLMHAIESYLLNENCEYLMSETQAQNLKALAVYKRYGINCEESYNVYHLWRKQGNN